MMESTQTSPATQQAAQTYISQRLAAGEGEQVTPDAPQTEKSPIPPEVQQALIQLASGYETDCDWLTRGQKKQIMESEEFWKGNHYGIWSEHEGRFWTPYEFAQTATNADMPNYDYVTNLYKTWGLITIAAITRKIPKVRAKPASAKSEKDIATAKAFDKIANLIERNNRMGELVREEARLLYVQGGYGAYCRFVRSEDYGVHEEPVIEEQDTLLQEEGFVCQTCGNTEAAPQVPATAGFLPTAPAAPVCQNCGTQLSDANYQPAEYGKAPVVTGYKKVADGMEKITIHGLLNLKLLPYASRQEESPYLILSQLYPTAAVRAAYPLKADSIGGTNASADGLTSTEDGRDARYQAALAAAPRPYGPFASTGATLRGMTLVKQAWLRKWALWQHADPKMRQQLLEMFPDGVHFTYVGKTFLSGENENVDKFWRVCIGPLGNGIYRGGVGQDAISVNKRVNDVANIQQEYVERAAFPTVFANAALIDMEAWPSKRQEAGSVFPVHLKAGGNRYTMNDLLYQPSQKLDGNIYNYGSSLIELGQLVTGALPSVFGGGVQYNETMGGYSQAREDALGRLQLIKKSMNDTHAQLMLIAVECFRENRTEDAELTVIQQSGEFASEFVRLDEVQGNITVEPEIDEDFPSTTTELREQITSLLQYAPELVTPLLTNPSNVDLVKRVFGAPDLIIPQEAARQKTFRDIFRLTQEQPQGFEPGPDGVMLAIPSVMPEMFVDDHVTAIATVKEWCQSSDPGQGIEMKSQNPQGYMNVVGYLLAHIKQQMQEQALANPQPEADTEADSSESGPPPAAE